MSDMVEDLRSAVRGITADWKRAKRRADKDDRVRHSDLARMSRGRQYADTLRDLAFKVMREAYMEASGQGRFYANGRQIMYSARRRILAIDERVWREGSSQRYFQELLKDYLERFRPSWKIVWDARGHLIEPHTGHAVGLGGLEVMKYASDWTDDKVDPLALVDPAIRLETVGPQLRYKTVLFIEKEGFHQILADAGIGERFDVALMSTKGLPVKAACELVQKLTRAGATVLVLRDFDLAGFKIVRTLRHGTRLMEGGAQVTDLGFRLAEAETLDSEPVTYHQKADPRVYLERCGATEAEREFLVHRRGSWGPWTGRRVELNAMPSDQLVVWLEKKLEEHGAGRVLPSPDVLSQAYQRAAFLQTVQEQAQTIRENWQTVEEPLDLEERVRAALADGELAWDDAVWALVTEVRNT